MQRLLAVFISLTFASVSQAAIKQIDGMYEAIVIDNANGSSELTESIIDPKTNRRIKLKKMDHGFHKKFATGDVIKVTGQLEGDSMTVSSAESLEVDNVEMNAFAVDNQIEKRVLSVIVDFADAQSHMTATSLPAVLSNTTKLFNEMSFGKIQINTDINKDGFSDMARVKISDLVSSPGCNSNDYVGWRSQAIDKLEDQGIRVSEYTNLILYLPDSVPCSWAGVGYVGSLRTNYLQTSWIKKESLPTPRVTVHELGHNLGLRHAGKDIDNDGFLENDYTDASCFMSSFLRGSNGPHLIELGAFEDHPHSVKEMTTREGYFTIAASDLLPGNTNLPHVVKVIKKIISPSKISYYYLSYKRGIGMYDKNMTSSYKVGVSIHSQYDSGSETHYIDSLAPGEVFTDAVNNITVKMIEKNADGSSVKVWVRQISPSCILAAPSIITAAVEMNNNSVLGSTVTIKNNDSSSCRRSLFALAGISSSSNLSSSMDDEVSLSPGESVMTSVRLESSPYPGSFSVAVKAKENLDGSILKSTSMAVTVKAVIPNAPTYLTKTTDDTNIILKWRASSSPSISSYKIYRKLYGEASFTVTGTVSGRSFTQALPAKQAIYYVKAIDLAGTVSPASSEIVYTPDSTISAPTDLATALTSSALTLSWKPGSSSAGISHYLIYRRNYDETLYTQIATTRVMTHKETLPTLRVYYKIKAVDIYGKISLYSDYKSYTPPSTITAATNLSLKVISSSITLKWTAATSTVPVERYKVFRKLYGSSDYDEVGTVTSLNYTEPKPSGRSATYFVRAYDVYGYYRTSSTVTYYR